jgi:tripartite-type tricarboxylate transporter receptor subunit TctC
MSPCRRNRAHAGCSAGGASQWYGLAAPKNTPAEIVDKLNKEINAAIADGGMKAKLAAIGGDPMPGPAAAFGKLIADETEK